MTTTPKTSHRSLASLNLSASKTPALITFIEGVVKAMSNNPSFPSPVPTLAVVTAANSDLQAAETTALARTKGAVTTRDEKRTALIVLVQQLRAYIQAVADANVENGASIIQSAGLSVKKTPVHPPRVFAAKQGATSGTAKVIAASAGHRASYEWEYSTDAGKTWIATPVTIQAKTSVTGLASGSTVQFRYKPVTKTGEGDWSQPVSLLVK